MRGFQRTLTTAFLVAAAGIVFASGAAQAKKFEVLESFGGHVLGSNPQGPVLIDKDGNIFGTASQEGPQGGGTVFELKRVRHGYKASSIFRFNGGGNGKNPTGALIMDTQGNLYGTASDVAFELSPVAGQRIWSETILHQFCSNGCGDGNQPVGGLTYQGASSGAPYDGVSPLYGVTAGGGANNGGAAFELTNNSGSWSESVLYSFCSQGGAQCIDGTGPSGGVILDNFGNLFGVTFEGGGRGRVGVVFELSPNGAQWVETVLYKFCSADQCTDGAFPIGSLVIDATGNLFGATASGGNSCPPDSSGCGTIFKIAPNGSESQEAVLYAFCARQDCQDGDAPQAGLLMDQSGNLFGTTGFGGGNDTDVNGLGGGVVFELAADTFKVLHSFCSEPNCADGEYPLATLSADSSSGLLGTTSLGGALGNDVDGGTLFKVKK